MDRDVGNQGVARPGGNCSDVVTREPFLDRGNSLGLRRSELRDLESYRSQNGTQAVRGNTHLLLRQPLAVVRTRWVTDVQESSLKSGSVSHGETEGKRHSRLMRSPANSHEAPGGYIRLNPTLDRRSQGC